MCRRCCDKNSHLFGMERDFACSSQMNCELIAKKAPSWISKQHPPPLLRCFFLFWEMASCVRRISQLSCTHTPPTTFLPSTLSHLRKEPKRVKVESVMVICSTSLLLLPLLHATMEGKKEEKGEKKGLGEISNSMYYACLHIFFLILFLVLSFRISRESVKVLRQVGEERKEGKIRSFTACFNSLIKNAPLLPVSGRTWSTLWPISSRCEKIVIASPPPLGLGKRKRERRRERGTPGSQMALSLLFPSLIVEGITFI